MSSAQLDRALSGTIDTSQDGGAVTIVNFDFDGNGAEMGFFFVFSLFCVFFLLNKLDGKFFRMKVYIMNRDFQLLRNPKVIIGVTYFIRAMSWFSILLPILALLVWSAGLIARAVSAKVRATAGITVLLVGLSLICFLIVFFRLKWARHQFDWKNGIFFFLTQAFLTGYQFVCVFVPETNSTFGISSVFLSANCLVMMAIVFMNHSVTNGSIDDLIQNKIQPGGAVRDPNRTTDFDQEVDSEKLNKDYVPTQNDIFDIFTIGKPEYRNKWSATSFGPGLQNFFGNLSPKALRITTLILWIVATGILVVYSYVLKKQFPLKGDLGFITMIALLTTDVLVFLIANANIVKTATPLCFTLFLNRFLLIIYGGDYWMYGYICIYLFYGILLTTLIAKKRFPFADDLSQFDIDQFYLDQKSKKLDVSMKVSAQAGGAPGANKAQQMMGNAMNKFDDMEQQVRKKFKLLTQPEHPLMIITVIYLIILLILTLVKPTRVPLPNLPCKSRTLHFFTAWAFSIILLCAYYTSLAVIRLFIRRKMGTTQKVYYEFERCLAMKKFRIDRYWVFIVLNLCSLVGVGIISWWLTDSWVSCVLVIFVDLYLLTVMNFYTHFMANDYNVLQNIDETNMKVRQHNARLDALKKEINDVKQKIVSGQGAGGVSKDMIERAKTIIEGKNISPGPNSPTKKQEDVKPKPVDPWQDNNPPAPAKPAPAPKPAPTPVPNNVKPEPPITSKPTDSTIGPANVNVRVQPTESDKLIEEEMNGLKEKEDGRKPPKKAAMADGIYEGGEAEEVTEIFVDPENEEEVDAKRYRIKYNEVQDWRKTTNFFAAFWKGQLRKNDYQIIFSWVASIIVLVIGAWLICASTKSYLGITIFVPFAHYSLAAYSHMKTLNTDSPMNAFEWSCFVFAYVVQYGWGIANLYLTYGLMRKKTATVTVDGVAIEEKIEYESSGVYIVVNLIVIPFITSCIAAIFKWIDNKGKLDRFLIGQLSLTLVQGIAMLVCAFVFMTWVQGIVVSCVIGVLCYVGFQVWIYQKNEYYMPTKWTYVNILVVICAIIAAFVASLIAPGFTIFLGFSISVWLLSILLFVFGFGRVMFDYVNLRKRPVFFSPWIFPIFRYDPKKQDIEKQNLPAQCLLASLVILIFWSVLATVWFTPTHVGVSLTIFFEMLLILTMIFLIQISHLQLKKVSSFVDNKIIRKAWLEAKQTYAANRNAQSRADLVTFEEFIMRRDLFRNKMRLGEGRPTLNQEEKWEGVKLIPQVSDADLSQWLNTSRVDMTQPLSQYQYLFELEKDLSKTYKLELELIIMFQILIIQYTQIYAEQKKKYLFNFLLERRPVLLALDIQINIPPTTSVNIQYAKVCQQIQELPVEKMDMFFELREKFVEEQRLVDDKRREQAANEESKSREREQNIADAQKRRREGIEDNKNKKNVADWVDCFEKYQKIMEEFKTSGQKFTDTQFQADGKALGQRCQDRGVEQWVRASQCPNKTCVLYKDKVSALDVKQGALGDCYFLSAISVLGDVNVVDMIKTKEGEWQKTGCFCVRFYREGQEEYVIVDDYFPARKSADGGIEWVFAQGGEHGDEIWSMVLEKAYAKLYGDYGSIEAGKVHYALADMVKGFPEQVDLKKDAKNLDVFWEKMKALKRQGALVGAGSPENPMGDAAINQLGIVQGHAYSVLSIDEIDDAKLIQLRNPHGATGAEWKGDWGDTCPNWNQRAKTKLKYQPKDHEDGVFWMDAYDFLQQYSYLYICRILTPQTGWKEFVLNSEWRGATAEGLPSRANPSARLELNPHFKITINKPSDAFISLRQDDPDPEGGSTFKGKNAIFFMVSKCDGERIRKVDKDLIVCRSGNPINLMTVTAECQFDTSVSYPYTFTLLVANSNKGPAGEGKFEVKVYSTDSQAKVEVMP